MSALDPKAQVDLGQLLNQAVAGAQREIEMIVLVFKERGAKRFARILGLGLGAVILSYVMIYSPAEQKSAGLARKIAAARATAQYSDRYKALQQRVEHVQSLLPSGQGDGWVLDRVRQTLNGRNLVSDSISPPESHALEGFTKQVVHFSMVSRFPDLVAWLNDLEFGKGVVHVTSLSIDKQSGENAIGENRITCAVEAALPGARPGP